MLNLKIDFMTILQHKRTPKVTRQNGIDCQLREVENVTDLGGNEYVATQVKGWNDREMVADLP